jgi:RNA polymerase sigma-70 factor (ECF subfamily)
MCYSSVSFSVTSSPPRTQVTGVVATASASLQTGADADVDRHGQLRVLFERDFDYVWNSLRRLGVHASDREDLAQDVFVHVYRRIEEFEVSRPSRPWLFAFVVRCAADWRRLAWRRVEPIEDYPEPASTTPGADEAIARTQDRELVERALQSIALDRRPVFILHELEESPMKEVAELLGIPLFTAYSRLRVAREEFAAAVRRLARSGGGK